MEAINWAERMAIVELVISTFKLSRMFALCSLCFFAAGLAWPQMVSSQVNATDGGTGGNSVSRSDSVTGQVSGGVRVSRVPATTASSAFSGVESRAMFDGGGEGFSGGNTREGEFGLASLGGNTDQTTTAWRASPGAAASTTRAPVIISGYSGTIPETRSGQFPDTTREIFWPSPPLYEDSNIFRFDPGLPTWKPDFAKESQLNLSYLANGGGSGKIGVLKFYARSWRPSVVLQSDKQLNAPLSPMNSLEKFGLGSSSLANPLSNSIEDPLDDRK